MITLDKNTMFKVHMTSASEGLLLQLCSLSHPYVWVMTVMKHKSCCVDVTSQQGFTLQTFKFHVYLILQIAKILYILKQVLLNSGNVASISL